MSYLILGAAIWVAASVVTAAVFSKIAGARKRRPAKAPVPILFDFDLIHPAHMDEFEAHALGIQDAAAIGDKARVAELETSFRLLIERLNQTYPQAA